MNRPALGKGLASLIPAAAPPAVPQAGAIAANAPTTVEQAEISNRDRHPGISLAVLDEIHVNPNQPRREFDEAAIDELAESIRANGVIQPLIVRKNAHGKYELIAGERRMRACKKVGLKQVPIVIRKSTDRESLEIALVENIQRRDLNCVEEALGYQQLMDDFNLTQEEVAKRVGKERATVANHLRLLKLPQEVLTDLRQSTLSFGHAKVILSVESLQDQLRMRLAILDQRMSVRAAEAYAEKLKGAAPEAPAPAPTTELSPTAMRLAQAAQTIGRQWSSKVEIKGNGKRGKIIFHYGNREDLDRLLQGMQK